jgi:uncharacterized protein (UPF0333 family)
MQKQLAFLIAAAVMLTAFVTVALYTANVSAQNMTGAMANKTGNMTGALANKTGNMTGPIAGAVKNATK